jgi:hypothetical protein
MPKTTRTARYAEALAAIGGLSHPDKMPTASWSIPATTCRLGSLLRKLPGTTCADCYALKGCYLFPSVTNAMARRFALLAPVVAGDTLETARWVEAFAIVLLDHADRTARVLKRRGRAGKHDGRFFRWHDSGDLQSVAHLRAIVAVVEATPNVRHWLPTREVGLVDAFVREGGEIPANLEIRISTPKVGQAPAGVLARLARDVRGISVSGVHEIGEAPAATFEACNAPSTEGRCADCRACWTSDVNVSYERH